MQKIFLDANFLIDMVRFKVDLDEINSLVGPHEFVVLSSVSGELRKISQTKKSESRYAILALTLAEKFAVEKSANVNADLDLIARADENSLVATNDSELRKILKGKGIKTIYLRSRKHLEIG